MRKIFFFAVIICLVVVVACSKTSTSSNPSVNNATSILPLKAGNIWIYQDSGFDANANLLGSYKDSSFITSLSTSRNGVNFYEINDSLGWFGTGSFLAVDPSNTSLYGLDSLNAASPYIFFANAPSDGYLIGSSSDLSNPACIGLDALYGFASTYNVAGHACYKSLDDVKDCNGNIIYAVVYYISPGVGIVRIEEYSPNPNSTTNNLYLDYSQTLQSNKLN